MRKTFVTPFLFLALLLSTPLTAQLYDDTYQGVFFGVNWQSIDTDGFSSQIEALNYPGLENNLREFSAGYARTELNTIGHVGFYFSELESSGDFTVNQQTEERFTRYRRIGSNLDLALNVLGKNRAFFVGPEVSTRLQFQQVVTRNDLIVADIEATQGAQFAKITQLSFPVSLGILLAKQFRISTTRDTRLQASLRFGYMLNTDEDWELDSAVEIQDFGLDDSGLYFGINLAILHGSRKD